MIISSRGVVICGLFLSLVMGGYALPVSAKDHGERPDSGVAKEGEQAEGVETQGLMRKGFIDPYQPKAYCFDFKQAIEDANDAAWDDRVALRKDGRVVPITSGMITVTGHRLCLNNLLPRNTYQLTLGNYEDNEGSTPHLAFDYTFTVGDFPASVGFVTEKGDRLFLKDLDPKVGLDDVRLHSLNIPQLRLTLYKLRDDAAMVETWLNRNNIRRAPSEVAVFARDHGDVVWTGTVDMAAEPNQPHNAGLPKMTYPTEGGMILIAQEAPEHPQPTDFPLPIQAALYVVHGGQKIAVGTEADTLVIAVGARSVVSLWSDDGRKLRTVTVDDNGVARVQPDDLSASAVIMVRSEQGGVYFVPTSRVKAIGDHRADRRRIVDQALREGGEITSYSDQSVFRLTRDASPLSDKSKGIPLALRSFNRFGRAQPYSLVDIWATPVSPDGMDLGYPDYHWGNKDPLVPQPSQKIVTVLTNIAGEAFFTLPALDKAWGAVRLSVDKPEATRATTASLDLVLSQDPLVGIKKSLHVAGGEGGNKQKLSFKILSPDLKPMTHAQLRVTVDKIGRNFSWNTQDGGWTAQKVGESTSVVDRAVQADVDGNVDVEWNGGSGRYQWTVWGDDQRILAQDSIVIDAWPNDQGIVDVRPMDGEGPDHAATRLQKKEPSDLDIGMMAPLSAQAVDQFTIPITVSYQGDVPIQARYEGMITVGSFLKPLRGTMRLAPHSSVMLTPWVKVPSSVRDGETIRITFMMAPTKGTTLQQSVEIRLRQALSVPPKEGRPDKAIRLMRMDGSGVDLTKIRVGETYVMVIPSSVDGVLAASFFSALRPIACVGAGDLVTDIQQHWLASTKRSVAECSVDAQTGGIVFAPSVKGDDRVIVVRAYHAGVFHGGLGEGKKIKIGM